MQLHDVRHSDFFHLIAPLGRTFISDQLIIQDRSQWNVQKLAKCRAASLGGHFCSKHTGKKVDVDIWEMLFLSWAVVCLINN